MNWFGWTKAGRILPGRDSPRAYGPVALLACVAGLGFGFARIASEMLEGDTQGFDRAVLLALRTAGDPAEPIGPAWFTDMVVNITSLGSNVVLGLVTAIVAGYLAFAGRRRGALLVIASAIGAALLSILLKDAFQRPRPDVVAHVVQAHSASFPSGHALGSAAVYLSLGLMLARFDGGDVPPAYPISVALLLTLSVGLSRLYLGVHWPTDVLAGWCIGACWAIGCWIVAGLLQKMPGNG